jgi:putative effector of murein hydrolase LrgA (UPF0299 family)
MALMILGSVQKLYNLRRSLNLDAYVECGGNAGWVIDQTAFVFVPIHIKILNYQQTIQQLFNVLETC